MCAAPLLAKADENGVIYTQVSTNGFGLGYTQSIDEEWAWRAQINALPRSKYTGAIGDFGSSNSLDLYLNMTSVQLLADWYLGDRGFRFTGGVVFNDNKITIGGTGDVNGKTAAVNGEIRMSETVAPYLGFGYSIVPHADRGFGLNYDVGMMFQTPRSKLTATGGGVTQADIDAQNAKVQDAINKTRLMLVLGIGVSYAF